MSSFHILLLPLLYLLQTPLFTIAAEINHPIWGTYRPQALISARAAVPHSPFFGFAYHPAHNLHIRHLAADHHDKIKSFSWSRHDPYTFGDQVIEDTDANLRVTSHFMNHPSKSNACVIRVSATALDPSQSITPTSLIFYAASGPDEVEENSKESPWGTINIDKTRDDYVQIRGNSDAIGGQFQIKVNRPSIGTIDSSSISIPQEHSTSNLIGQGSRARIRKRSEKPSDVELDLDKFQVSSFSVAKEKIWGIEKILSELFIRRPNKSDKSHSKFHLLDDSTLPGSPGVFVQRIVQAPFQMEASFVLTEERNSDEVTAIEKDLSGENLSATLKEHRDNFDDKFEKIFKLKEKSVSPDEIHFAKTALSNLLGGIGYFFGNSIAKNINNPTQPDVLPPIGLLTATPSRALFPRGFLWDEGFHQLLIQRWNPELSRRCLESWLSASQQSGWIPREQILGIEARSRFPQHVQHLIIQDPVIANPPTILMPLRLLAENLETSCASVENDQEERCTKNKRAVQGLISDILPKAANYYSWLKTEQAGEVPGSFKWQGRHADTKSPDGYPLTLASGLDDYPRGNVATSSERHLDLHCWVTWASDTMGQISRAISKPSDSYFEEHEELKTGLFKFHGTSDTQENERENLLLCDYDGDDRICHEGYVTILPLALGLLAPDDPRVSAILDSLEDPNLLRGTAGIRSLSKKNQWHRKGDDYWTGSVWIPFNFLTLAALRTKYSQENGPYRERSEQIYKEIKNSILANTFREFKRTGQLWENYSPDDEGQGKSGRQFTGWSSLVVLLYADMFDGVV